MPEKAALEMEKAVDLSGRSPLYVAALRHACALAGDRLSAQSLLDELKRSPLQRYVSPLDIALVYAGMGDNDSAFVWLEKAYQERVTRLQELPQPSFDGLRSDARFAELMRRLGLPLPWGTSSSLPSSPPNGPLGCHQGNPPAALERVAV